MRSTLISILNIICCAIAFGQGFYPLHVGNRWEYWETPANYYAWTTRATRDTVMPNDSSFTQLRSEPPNMGYGGFFRQQGPRIITFVVLQQAERIAYDFSKTIGDTVGIWYFNGDTMVTTVLYDRFQNVFGRIRRQWGFYQWFSSSTFYIIDEITDSIGLTYMQVEPGYEWYLRGAIINGIQYGEITTVPPSRDYTPESYKLLQNYPNPFNSSTTIRFRVPSGEDFLIDVVDLLGRKVRTLHQGRLIGEFQSVNWNGEDDSGVEQASGVYLCRIQTKNYNGSIKMILLH